MNLKTLVLSAALAPIALLPTYALATDGHDMHGNMEKMEAHMQSMETEMAQIRDIKDPTARKKAMEAHMRGMMQMMHGMQSAPKMAGGSEGKQIAYLTQRVDLLQAMVGQMVQSRAASYGIYPDALGSALSDEEYKGQ